jgi:endonuclease/exonuclease/phosphatase family metal-dependent hydrolase
VFHGRTHPPSRRAHLHAAIELVTADAPDIVCLQEVPAWGLLRLAGWSSMHAFPATTRRAPFGTRLGRAVTDAHHGVMRSAVSGQGNAILLASRLAAEDLGGLQISEPRVHRRVCHAVRLGDGMVIANLHSSPPPWSEAETARALAWLDEHAGASGPLVLAGDFNDRPQLEGFSPPGPGIDHVLARGLEVGPLYVWPEERRRQNGRLLSDHPPVELRIAP